MMLAGACPRCGGAVFLAADEVGRELLCTRCAWSAVLRPRTAAPIEISSGFRPARVLGPHRGSIARRAA